MQGHNSVELVPQMLVGKELLDKARSLSNRPEDDIARGCGYVGPSGRLLKKSFYRALVEAKAEAQGWQLPRPTSRSSAAGETRGRQADFRTRVHGNGNHRDSGAIWLHQLGGEQTDQDQSQPCSESHSDEMPGDA